MDYSIIFALVGGMFLSQAMNFSYQFYHTLVENDKKRSELLAQEISRECEKNNLLISNAEKRLEEQSVRLEKKLSEQEAKVTEVLASITSKVSTERGTYATYSGTMNNGVLHIENMDKCSDALVVEFKKFFNDIGDRQCVRDANADANADAVVEGIASAGFSVKGQNTLARLAGYSIQNSHWVPEADATGIGLDLAK
jgi:hypothetical protein